MAYTGGPGCSDVESPASSSSEGVSADAVGGKAESGLDLQPVAVSLRKEDYQAPADLKFVLEELSPELDATRVMHSLNVLADELIGCGEEEESMVGVCQEMRELLVQVAQAVDFVSDIASASSDPESADDLVSGVAFKLIWAFTWVETLLLEHAMLQDCSSQEMQAISERWETVHICWPPTWERTKSRLDFHRRLALLACGREKEAVEGYQAPDYWEGFEACFLCFVTSIMYNPLVRKPGRLSLGYADFTKVGERCLHWLQRAERAGPRDHEHWPLVRVHVLMLQHEYLRWFGLVERSRQLLDTALEEIQELDVQLQFDFPVPLPEIQCLKFELVTFLAHHRRTGWQPNELVPGIGPDVLDMLDVVDSFRQARYACSCLVLRGWQLICHFGQVEEGLELFDTCLAKFSADFVDMPWLETYVFRICTVIIVRDIANMADLGRADRLQAFLVAHRMSLDPPILANMFIRNAFAVCGFSGPATFMPSVVPALCPSNAILEAFWESYKESCAALLSSAAATERRYEMKHLGNGNKLRVLTDAWVPYLFLFHVHAVAATVSKLLPPRAEAADGDIARQALLSLEGARNTQVKGFGPHVDWKWIERAQLACGPDTVFVQFAGSTRTVCVGMLDVCIVVQDGGVASCHRLDHIDSETILEHVREISDACLQRKLENDCCRNALETLYDLLIRPLFHRFIRESRNRVRNPHRKFVISAVGVFQNVPFNILRNRDSGCYLFEEVRLAFTPSFLQLDMCQSQYETLQEMPLLAGAGAAVALGDPHYLAYQGRPLPGSRKEVDAICELFKFCHAPHEIVKLVGDDATVEKLLEWVKKPSDAVSGTECSQAFIHVAAHGSGGKEADHGTLRLASASTQTRRRRRAAQGKAMRDGPASSDEESYEFREAAVSSDAVLFGHHMLQQEAFESDIAAEGLDKLLPRLLRSPSSDVGTSVQCDNIMLSGAMWCAYMVVLSACNTGVGVTLHHNDLDVLSFSRAFMSVGVPCSVLAQWPVDDSAALLLMPLFYEALIQGEDACSALQSAMIKMHQAGKYTLHQIAPFVVTGLPTVRLPPQMRRCPALDLASNS